MEAVLTVVLIDVQLILTASSTAGWLNMLHIINCLYVF